MAVAGAPERSLNSSVASVKADDEVAAINCELFKLTGEASYQETAVALYRTMWEKTSDIDYKDRLAELEAAKSSSAD